MVNPFRLFWQSILFIVIAVALSMTGNTILWWIGLVIFALSLTGIIRAIGMAGIKGAVFGKLN